MLKQRILAQTAILVLCVCSVAGAQAAEPQTAAVSGPAPAAPAPRLVKYSGALKDRLGRARTGVTGLTLALYKDQEGGATLWLETQNAELDEQGRYTVLLGATRSEGLPLELFTTGEQRWLGVQVILPGVEEEPRVLLVSVPYALKAADAETLGGKPLTAFVLAPPEAAGSNRSPSTPTSPLRTTPPAALDGSGTLNKLAKWTGANTLGDSGVFESGGLVGIGYAPEYFLDVNAGFFRSTFNTRSLPASSNLGGLAVGWNRSNGQAEVNFYNVFNGAGTAFQFSQKTAAATASDLMTILGNGNVGIGPTSPVERLEVAGNTNITGYAHLGNSSPNSFPNSQGAYIGWNRSQSLGEVNFINHNGGGTGSGSFFFDKTNGSSFTRLLTISGTGGIIFPDSSVQTTACGFLFGPAPEARATGRAGRAASVAPMGAVTGGSSSDCTVAASLAQALQEQRLQIQQLQEEVASLKERLEALAARK